MAKHFTAEFKLEAAKLVDHYSDRELAGEHATKLLSYMLHRMAKKRWFQMPTRGQCA